MKKLIIISIIITFGFVSCKKEYTCKCQQTYVTTAYYQYGVYHPQTITSSSYTNTYKMKEDKAKSNCKNHDKLSINSYGTGESHRTTTETVECELY